MSDKVNHRDLLPPLEEKGLYGTTIEYEIEQETETRFSFKIVAKDSPQLEETAYVRAEIRLLPESEEERRKLFAYEVHVMLMGLDAALHTEAVKRGVYREERPGLNGERYIYGYQGNDNMITFEALSQSGNVLGRGGMKLVGESKDWLSVFMQAQQLRRDWMLVMRRMYTTEEYLTLVKA